MKQTAVEWLKRETIQLLAQAMQGTLNIDTLEGDVYRIVTQAKAMEKEQIEEAFFKGDLFAEDYFDADNPTKDVSENYYKQTYESKTNI
jgi:hypothetical protein